MTVYDTAAEELDRETICCVKCGYVMGMFGDGSNCNLICPRCKPALEIIVTDEGTVVRKKAKRGKRVKEQKS